MQTQSSSRPLRLVFHRIRFLTDSGNLWGRRFSADEVSEKSWRRHTAEHANRNKQKTAVAGENALQCKLFLLQYWHSRSSKVNDFYVIRKPICHYLLVINSNLGPISYRFRDTANYSLKPAIENCGQTAADGDIVTIDSL